MPIVKLVVPDAAPLKKVKAKLTLKMKEKPRPIADRKRAKL